MPKITNWTGNERCTPNVIFPPVAEITADCEDGPMFLLFAALISQQKPVWWHAFQREYDRCGLVFNVDAPGPPGDGLRIEKGYGGLILSRSGARRRAPIDCIAAWAKKNGIKVRYKNS